MIQSEPEHNEAFFCLYNGSVFPPSRFRLTSAQIAAIDTKLCTSVGGPPKSTPFPPVGRLPVGLSYSETRNTQERVSEVGK